MMPNYSRDELKLEQVAKQVEEFELHKSAPIFEIYAFIVAIIISILLFLLPDMLAQDKFLYTMMKGVFSQSGWALSFFTGGIVGACGLLFRKNRLRVTALALLAMLYGTLAVCYGIGFPNIGTVVMACMAVFTLVSIPIVKFTGLGR